jgi:hypothetical protein
MNRANVRNTETLPADTDKQSGSASAILRLLWIVPGVAVLCLLLFLSMGRTKLSESGIELVVVFVYSTFIGPPSAILCNWLGHHFADRYPRLVILFYVLALLFAATVGCFATGFALQWMRIVRPGAYWDEFWGSWPFALVITLMVGLSISTFETLRSRLKDATLELRTRQVEQERANKLLVEARLSSLESRIHPHFLFNTLNSIAALIPSDPVRAEDTVSKLASLLRFSLNANHSSLVPLAQELKVVRDYLEIESTRFGPRLRYEIAVPESLGSVKVPPLALQSLVENSVKHVAAQRSEGATIQISGLKANGRMQLNVSDDGPGFSLGSISPEHGLGNLSARLQLLFDDAGQLDVKRENGKTIARISFPAES